MNEQSHLYSREGGVDKQITRGFTWEEVKTNAIELVDYNFCITVTVDYVINPLKHNV